MSTDTPALDKLANEDTDRARHENGRSGVAFDGQKGLVVVDSDVDWPASWMPLWLEAYGRTFNATVACKLIGVSRQGVHAAAKAHPVFGEAWRQARLALFDGVEGRMIRDALSGNTVAQIFLLKNNLPEVYSERLELRHTGAIEHRHGVIEGKEPRELDAVRRHEAVRLRLLEAGSPETVEGSEAA